MPVNAGERRHVVIESDGKFALRRSMKQKHQQSIFAATSRLTGLIWQTVPWPNNRLDSQTPISANLGIDYKLNRIPLTIGD